MDSHRDNERGRKREREKETKKKRPSAPYGNLSLEILESQHVSLFCAFLFEPISRIVADCHDENCSYFIKCRRSSDVYFATG